LIFFLNTHFLHFRSIFTLCYSPTSLPALARHFRSFFLIPPNFASTSRTISKHSALISFFFKYSMNHAATRLAVHFCAFHSLNPSAAVLPFWTLHVNDIQRQNPSGNSSLSPLAPSHHNYFPSKLHATCKVDFSDWTPVLFFALLIWSFSRIQVLCFGCVRSPGISDPLPSTFLVIPGRSLGTLSPFQPTKLRR
jgi:hypothetical protein